MPSLPANRWERFAREDAEFYICTELDPRLKGAARSAAFYSSGDEEVGLILDRTAAWRSGAGVAIDFGCGVGRLAIPMSRHYGEVRAVDVAPTMLERLAENARRHGRRNMAWRSPKLRYWRRNIRTFLSGDAGWWQDAEADFAYSLLVFQHIEDAGEIETAVRRLGHALAPGGVAYLQFDTRRATPSYRLRNFLPDGALPAHWRRGVRRIRRPSGLVRRIFAAAGLGVAAEFDPDALRHAFVLRKGGEPGGGAAAA